MRTRDLIGYARCYDAMATPGPWHADIYTGRADTLYGPDKALIATDGNHQAADFLPVDAEAIAWMRNNIRALADALDTALTEATVFRARLVTDHDQLDTLPAGTLVVHTATSDNDEPAPLVWLRLPDHDEGGPCWARVGRIAHFTTSEITLPVHVLTVPRPDHDREVNP